MLGKEWSNAKNILVVRLDNIGDVIMTGPALRAIKENLPDCRITLLASRTGAQATSLLWPIDRVMIWRAVWQDVGNSMPTDAARELQLVEEIAEAHFDAAIILTSFSQSPYPPAYICYLAEIPLRLGQSKEFGGSVLTTWIKSAEDGTHQVERSLHLMRRAGFVVSDPSLFLNVPKPARQSVDLKLLARGIERGQPFMLVHPGVSCSARTYSFSRWSKVALDLKNRVGLPVVISGNEKDARRLDQMDQGDWSGTAILAGETTVEEFAALVERSVLVLTGHTSPMHLADALRKPSVVLFSGTDLESEWRPRSSPCRILRRETPCVPCRLFTCPFDMQCLDVEPEEVVVTALDLLERSGVRTNNGSQLP